MPEANAFALTTPRQGRFSLLPAQTLAVLGGVLLLASWLAPNHYPPWTSFHGEAASFAALCLFAAARSLTRDPMHLGRGVAVPALLVLLIAVQWLAGRIWYSGDALLSGTYVAGAALAFALGANARPRRLDPFTVLAALVVAAACASVLVAVLQFLRLETYLGIFAANRDPDARVFSNLGQPNHLATLCVMATALALWLRREGHLLPWQWLALLLWLSTGVTLTESRSGLIGAAVVGVLLLWGRRWLPRARSLVVGWWATLAAGWLGFPLLSTALLLEPTRTYTASQDSLRTVMWRQALVAIGDAPWAGHGWRQTMLAMKQASLQVPGRVPTEYAHNIVLDLLIWVGIPLSALMVGAGCWWLWRAWRRIASARELLLLAATVPVLVHSQFEFPFAYAYFLFPVCWLFGALHSAQSPRLPGAQSRSPRDLRALIMLAVLAYGALCALLASEYLEAEEDFRVMRFEMRKVGRVPVGYEAPHLVLLTQLGELLQVGRIEPKPDMDPALLRRMGLAAERNGWATLDLNYAVALAMNHRTADAERQLAQLSTVYGPSSAQQAYEMFRAFQAAHPEMPRVRTP